jgi:hypothetical protein
MFLNLSSLVRAACVAAFATLAFAQTAPAPSAPAAPVLRGDAAVQSAASKGVPPRATPADYETHVQMGPYTLAAEFMGHSVPTPDSIFSNADFVTVEVALFGPADSRIRLSWQDFSMRINGKKVLVPSEPYGATFGSLKDPSYIPPETLDKEKASKGGLSTGGGGGGGASDTGNLPPIIHIPIGIERAMEQKVATAALPEGERPLPAAGLIFFRKSGKSTSIELIYSGPAGKATVPLHP